MKPDGLENTPQAFVDLLEGNHFGKPLVKFNSFAFLMSWSCYEKNTQDSYSANDVSDDW